MKRYFYFINCPLNKPHATREHWHLDFTFKEDANTTMEKTV